MKTSRDGTNRVRKAVSRTPPIAVVTPPMIMTLSSSRPVDLGSQ
jgi:hypothetical protein